MSSKEKYYVLVTDQHLPEVLRINPYIPVPAGRSVYLDDAVLETKLQQ